MYVRMIDCWPIIIQLTTDPVRYQSLRLPVHCDEYAMKHTFVQAQGHRAVSRMLPFLLFGLLDHDFMALVIAWEQFQQLCHGERRPGGLTYSVGQEIKWVFSQLICLQVGCHTNDWHRLHECQASVLSLFCKLGATHFCCQSPSKDCCKGAEIVWQAQCVSSDILYEFHEACSKSTHVLNIFWLFSSPFNHAIPSSRDSACRLVVLAERVLPAKDLASIKFHWIVEHAWRDVLNHGNPYNHDAQGALCIVHFVWM